MLSLCLALTNRLGGGVGGGSPFSFHRKTTSNGQCRLQMIIFERRAWGEFPEKHLFSRIELLKSKLKALGLQDNNYLFLCDL